MKASEAQGLEPVAGVVPGSNRQRAEPEAGTLDAYMVRLCCDASAWRFADSKREKPRA